MEIVVSILSVVDGDDSANCVVQCSSGKLADVFEQVKKIFALPYGADELCFAVHSELVDASYCFSLDNHQAEVEIFPPFTGG